MNQVPAEEAAARLDALIDEVVRTHEPILLAGEFGNAVLVGEADWRAQRETLALAGMPGMSASIVAGMACPVDECEDELSW